jgi:hypothetical protein
MEQRSFQSQVRGIDKQAPFVWIMSFVKDFRERVEQAYAKLPS